MELITILGIGRIAERLIIVVIAGLSFYFGYRLFNIKSSKSEEEAEFSYKTFLIKLKKVGPGVFFSLFGSAIVITSLINPLSYNAEVKQPYIENDGPPINSFKYLSDSEKNDLRRWIISLNFITSIAEFPINHNITSPDRSLLKENSIIAIEIRNYLLGMYFNPQKRDTWLRWKDTLSNNPNEVPEDILETVRAVDKLGSLTMTDGA